VRAAAAARGVRSGDDFGCDLVEMELHGVPVAGRQHEGGTNHRLKLQRAVRDLIRK
jgi:hypothetical protein